MLSTPHKSTPPVILAFLAERFDDFNQALQALVDINETDAAGKTILAYCLEQYEKTRHVKYCKIAMQLLEKKADVTHESVTKLWSVRYTNDSDPLVMLVTNMRNLKEAKDIPSKCIYSFKIASGYYEMGNKNQSLFWFHFSAMHGNPKAMDLLVNNPGGLIAQTRYFEAIFWLEKYCQTELFLGSTYPSEAIATLDRIKSNLIPQVAFRAHIALCRIYIKFNNEQKALLHLKSAKTMFHEIPALQNIQAIIELHLIAAAIIKRTDERQAISEYVQATELGDVDSAFQIAIFIKNNKFLVERAEEKIITFCMKAMRNALISGDEKLINETRQRLNIFRSEMPLTDDFSVIFNAILELKLDEPIEKPSFNKDKVSSAFEKNEKAIKLLESKKLADLDAKKNIDEVESKKCVAEAAKLITEDNAAKLIKWVLVSDVESKLLDEKKDHMYRQRIDALLKIYFETSNVVTRKLINNVFIELSKYKLTPQAMEKILKFIKYINCQINMDILTKEMQENYVPALHFFDQYLLDSKFIHEKQHIISRVVLCAKLLCLAQNISEEANKSGIPENEIQRMRTMAQDFLDACQRQNEESLYKGRSKTDIAECQLFAMWCHCLYINSRNIVFNSVHDIDVYFLKSPETCNFLTPTGTDFDKSIIVKRMKKSYENLRFTSDWIARTTKADFCASIPSLKDTNTLNEFEAELKTLPTSGALINNLLKELEKAVAVIDEKQVNLATQKIIVSFEYCSKQKYNFTDLIRCCDLFKKYKSSDMESQQTKLIFLIINALLQKLDNVRFLHAFLINFFHAYQNKNVSLTPDELDSLLLIILTTGRKLYFSNDIPFDTKQAVKYGQVLPMSEVVRENFKAHKERRILLDDMDIFNNLPRLQKMMQENSIRGLHLFDLYMSKSWSSKQHVISRVLLCTKILCLTRGDIADVTKNSELSEEMIKYMRLEAQKFLSICQQPDTEEAKNLYKNRAEKDIMECMLFAEWCDDFQLHCQNQEFGDVDAYLLQATTSNLLPLPDQKNFLSKKTGEVIDKVIIQKRMELAYKNLGASEKWIAEKYKQPVAIITKTSAEFKSSSAPMPSLPVPSAPELSQVSVIPAFTAVYPQIMPEEDEKLVAENPASQISLRGSRTI